MFFESIWDRTTKHMQTPQNCGNFGNLTSCIDSQWGLNLTNSENQRAQLANRIWSIRVRDLSVLVKCFVRGDVSLKFNNITGHSSRSIQSLELAVAVGFFFCVALARKADRHPTSTGKPRVLLVFPQSDEQAKSATYPPIPKLGWTTRSANSPLFEDNMMKNDEKLFKTNPNKIRSGHLFQHFELKSLKDFQYHQYHVNVS